MFVSTVHFISRVSDLVIDFSSVRLDLILDVIFRSFEVERSGFQIDFREAGEGDRQLAGVVWQAGRIPQLGLSDGPGDLERGQLPIRHFGYLKR